MLIYELQEYELNYYSDLVTWVPVEPSTFYDSIEAAKLSVEGRIPHYIKWKETELGWVIEDVEKEIAFEITSVGLSTLKEIQKEINDTYEFRTRKKN